MNRNDDFAADLRRATAELPPSQLDLHDVLVSARSKARRSRALSGLASVVALATVGAGVWTAAPTVFASREAAGPAAAGLPGGEAPAAASLCTQPEDFQVTSWETGWHASLAATDVAVLGSGHQSPGDLAESGRAWHWELPGDLADSGRAWHWELPGDLADSGRAWHWESGGTGADAGSTSVRIADVESSDVRITATEPALSLTGLSSRAAQRAVRQWWAVASLDFDSAPAEPVPVTVPDDAPRGIHVVYQEGRTHSVHGVVTCGDSSETFELSWFVPTGSGVVSCAAVMAAPAPQDPEQANRHALFVRLCPATPDAAEQHLLARERAASREEAAQQEGSTRRRSCGERRRSGSELRSTTRGPGWSCSPTVCA